MNGLGNLEEKGIRLVRLRRVRRATKRKAPAHQGSDATVDQSQKDDNEAQDDGEAMSNEEEEFDRFKKIPDKLSTVQAATDTDVKTITEKEKNDVKITFTPRSTTSSASSFSRAVRDAEEQSVIGTNREPYLTPLLPNLTPQDTARESYTTTAVTTPSAKQSTQLVPLVLTVEQATPTNLEVKLADKNSSAGCGDIEHDKDEVCSESGPPAAGGNRRIRRSSSLLSVPTSDTSEMRPRMDTQRTLEENPDLVISVGEPEGSIDEMTSRTIATQTGGRD